MQYNIATYHNTHHIENGWNVGYGEHKVLLKDLIGPGGLSLQGANVPNLGRLRRGIVER